VDVQQQTLDIWLITYGHKPMPPEKFTTETQRHGEAVDDLTK
jgi:hypothetical protein